MGVATCRSWGAGLRVEKDVSEGTGVGMSDVTIPAPGSSTARGLVSWGLQRLLRELPGLAVPTELRGGHAAVLQALRAGLERAPGAVWSALRRPTVGTLIRCLRAEPRAAWVCELDATLAVELAVAVALVRPIVVMAPPRVVCLGARQSFALTPGVLRCAAGEVVHRDPAGRERVVWGEGVTGAASHVAIAGGLTLALVDNNPLAEVEAHPDKQGNAIDLGGQAIARWVAGLAEARAIVAATMPALADEIEVVLQQVVPVGWDKTRHLSASYQEAIGTVYLSLHPNPLTLAEALIHEFSHNKLHALLEQGALLENAFLPLFASPVRPDPRPLHGVLLAVHAFLPVARMYEALVVGRPELQRRFVEVVAGNREAAATLRAHARPTALGAALLAEIDRWDRHYEGV
jgi:HEXXH motif-containing protein